MALAGVRRDYANFYGDMGGQQSRHNRLAERVEPTERLLALADA